MSDLSLLALIIGGFATLMMIAIVVVSKKLEVTKA